MKINLDISRLNQAALKRGVGFYTKNLYQGLKNLKDSNQYCLTQNKLKKANCDLIHYPYFDPFFLTLPLIKEKPAIVTVHDLIPLKFPQYYPAGIRGRIKWQLQKLSLKKAKAIITDSNNSKKDIKEIIGFPDDKIFVVYLAANKKFRKLEAGDWRLEIKKKYHLSENFFLYVGDLNWNKNVKGLIRAFSIINHQSSNTKLVLIGNAFKNKQLPELQQLQQLIQKLNLKKEITLLGFIPANDLAAIYNLASLYIQPSFYEGFGLPILEAMSCGCPVLSSNQASLPEVGGEAIKYFNPYKKNDLEEKLLSLMLNKKKLIELGMKGLKWAKKFSWRKTALATRKVYQYAMA